MGRGSWPRRGVRTLTGVALVAATAAVAAQQSPSSPAPSTVLPGRPGSVRNPPSIQAAGVSSTSATTRPTTPAATTSRATSRSTACPLRQSGIRERAPGRGHRGATSPSRARRGDGHPRLSLSTAEKAGTERARRDGLGPRWRPWQTGAWGCSRSSRKAVERGYAAIRPSIRGSTGYGEADHNAMFDHPCPVSRLDHHQRRRLPARCCHTSTRIGSDWGCQPWERHQGWSSVFRETKIPFIGKGDHGVCVKSGFGLRAQETKANQSQPTGAQVLGAASHL